MQARNSNVLKVLGLSFSFSALLGVATVVNAPQAIAGPTCAAALAENAKELDVHGEVRSEMPPEKIKQLYKDFVTKYPAEAEQLASTLISSGAILGPVHLIALKSALVELGLTPAEIKKSEYSKETGVIFRVLNRHYKSGEHDDLNFRIAEGTLAQIIRITRAENTAPDFLTREVKALEASKELKVSRKALLKNQDALKDLVSSEEKRAFVLTLINETNPIATKMVIGDNSTGPAFSSLLGSFAGIAVVPLSISAFAPGVESLAIASSALMTGTTLGTLFGGPKFVSAPIDMVRRTIAKYRIKKMIKETRGEAIAEGLLTLPADTQAGLIKEAEQAVDHEFHRTVFLAAAPEIESLPPASLVRYGDDVLKGVLTIPDRQTALMARRELLVEQLTALKKTKSALKGGEDLKKGIARSEEALVTLIADASEFEADLHLVKRSVFDYREALDRGAADASKQVYINLARSEFENAQTLLRNVSTAHQELVNILTQELQAVRDAKMQVAQALTNRAADGARTQAGLLDGVLKGIVKKAKN